MAEFKNHSSMIPIMISGSRKFHSYVMLTTFNATKNQSMVLIPPYSQRSLGCCYSDISKVGNAALKYDLKRQIHGLTQGDSLVATYFHKLRNLWQELDHH